MSEIPEPITSATHHVYPVAALAVLSGDSLLLLKWKGGSQFVLPGVRPEAGETEIEAALRGAAQHTGLAVEPDAVAHLGQWLAAAAGADDSAIVADVFATVPATRATPTPGPEVEALRWVDLRSDDVDSAEFAPLIRAHVVPALQSLLP